VTQATDFLVFLVVPVIIGRGAAQWTT